MKLERFQGPEDIRVFEKVFFIISEANIDTRYVAYLVFCYNTEGHFLLDRYEFTFAISRCSHFLRKLNFQFLTAQGYASFDVSIDHRFIFFDELKCIR